jgi:hypothetical protein
MPRLCFFTVYQNGIVGRTKLLIAEQRDVEK